METKISVGERERDETEIGVSCALTCPSTRAVRGRICGERVCECKRENMWREILHVSVCV